jgi:hypothetical protein
VVAGADAEGLEADAEGVGAGADADGSDVLGVVLGESTFEVFELAAEEKPSRVENAGDGGVELVSDRLDARGEGIEGDTAN